MIERMPADTLMSWKGQLSNAEIQDVLTSVRSLRQ